MISAYGKPTPLSVPSSMTGAHVRAAVDGGAHFLIIPVSPMPSTRDRGWGPYTYSNAAMKSSMGMVARSRPPPCEEFIELYPFCPPRQSALK